ncbi:MAG: undecaprenyl-phosphate glucose phosphotransferase [Propionibacteriaceae bacterium]|jgi:Undecaprenyl-phosphate glucose phosphotransferase|nr:undecaprenyl-phosphate glucose phosphotransferase [Propionibacteriaceae bacterium]
MIRRNQGLINALSRILDVLLLFVAYFVVTFIRFDQLGEATQSAREVWTASYLTMVGVYALFTVFLYYVVGLYRSQRIQSFARDLRLVPLVNAVSTLALITFLYLTRFADFSRWALFFNFAVATILIILKRGATRIVMRRLRRRGYNQKHVLVVGTGPLATEYAESIADNPAYGFTIDGYLGTQPGADQLGTIADLEELLADSDFDAVIVALEVSEAGELQNVINSCEKQGVRTFIIPFFNDYTSSHLEVENIGNCKLINIRSLPLDDPARAALKRGFDLVVAILLVVLLSWLLLLIAIGVKLTSRGPILFKQTRVGWGGKPFTMYKFRSMRVNDAADTAWSTDSDTRRTKFGALLRKLSLDEFPQLFNVIKGDMSLVGPRPEIPVFVEEFTAEIPLYMVKHQVRPGMTGWAQIHGLRGDTSISKRIRRDIWYLENWTFDLDLRILARTAFRMTNTEKIVSEPAKTK